MIIMSRRWLWTSGQLSRDGWIPWDVEVVNAAPAALQWKKSAAVVKARLPGLYRLCVSVFTSLPVGLQVREDRDVLSFM
jgi:hypothetical protein